jgi:RHS repeat-associated protein
VSNTTWRDYKSGIALSSGHCLVDDKEGERSIDLIPRSSGVKISWQGAVLAMTLEASRCHDIFFSHLGGLLIGSDTLPPWVPASSTTAGSAQVLGNQLYGPYGNLRYNAGTIGTVKGFTGQYNDALTGLDYYGARSYDPLVGQFISADDIEGNLQAADPYAYVGGNPETDTDPTGQFRYDPATGQASYGGSATFQYNVPFATLLAPPVAPVVPWWSTLWNGIKHVVHVVAAVVNTVVHKTASVANAVGKGLLKAASQASSCNAGGIAQVFCGNGIAHIAFYGPGGGQIGVPGLFNLESGQGGGSKGRGEEPYSILGSTNYPIHEGTLRIEDPGNQPYSEEELATARFAARNIFHGPHDSVVLRSASGTRSATGATSDLVINGRTFDIYSPETNNVDSIYRVVRNKNSQATGIMLNLTNTSVDGGQVSKFMARLVSRTAKDGVPLNILDISVIDDTNGSGWSHLRYTP